MLARLCTLPASHATSVFTMSHTRFQSWECGSTGKTPHSQSRWLSRAYSTAETHMGPEAVGKTPMEKETEDALDQNAKNAPRKDSWQQNPSDCLLSHPHPFWELLTQDGTRPTPSHRGASIYLPLRRLNFTEGLLDSQRGCGAFLRVISCTCF